MNLEFLDLLYEEDYEYGIHGVVYTHMTMDVDICMLENMDNKWTLYHGKHEVMLENTDSETIFKQLFEWNFKPAVDYMRKVKITNIFK